MIRCLIFVFLVMKLSFCIAQQSDNFNMKQFHSPKDYIDSILFMSSDTSMLLRAANIEEALLNGDTLLAIEILNSTSQAYCNRVNFAKSYDGYWHALLLSDQIGNPKSKAKSYIGLGVLYSLYERRDKALAYYLKSLDLNKEHGVNGEIDSNALVDNYFRLGIHYKYDSLYQLAHVYLDSCEMFEGEYNPFLKAERAHIYALQNRFDTAEMIFSTALADIKVQQPGYLTVLCSYLGDLYVRQARFEESIGYFRKSLQAAYKFKSHINFVPDNYLKLSKVMNALGNLREELIFLKYANDINEKLYSSRSPNNKYLLEIRDTYRIAQDQNEKLRKEQELINLEQKGEIAELRVIVLFTSIVFLITLGVLLFKYWRAKHKAEKLTLEQIRQKEKKQAEEILKIKNSELTGSTLEIIVKDELLSQLKAKLKMLDKAHQSLEIRQLIKEIELNKDQSWINFENRFNAVNKGFHDAIKLNYPSLKPYDLKVCSLIKLGFSGKEMARLLGISPESANTARYRLRKKLGLQKEVDLVQFINQIVG